MPSRHLGGCSRPPWRQDSRPRGRGGGSFSSMRSKANPRVSDYLLGIEEALTLANGRRSTLGSPRDRDFERRLGRVVEMEGVSRASVRRFVEQEAATQFRPEVLARFTSVVVFGHLTREVRLRICERMLERETAFQSAVLSRKVRAPAQGYFGGGRVPKARERGLASQARRAPMRNVAWSAGSRGPGRLLSCAGRWAPACAGQ